MSLGRFEHRGELHPRFSNVKEARVIRLGLRET
jgi:hypothetical protein